MNEITSVTLENEMDLILAHKQSMRLAELTGLSLSAQTTFATAVSEVSRNAIGAENNACLKLYVSEKADKIKFITAVLEDNRKVFLAEKDEGYIYAKRLVTNIQATSGTQNSTELRYRIPPTYRIDDIVIEKLRVNLNTDPAVSPYEEIKRKNRQLIELTERLRESEQQYKSLTDSLPIMIFTIGNDGSITYANQWLQQYTGKAIEEINSTNWKDIVHADDTTNFFDHSKTQEGTFIHVGERRLKNINSNEYRWHTGVSIAIADEDGTTKSWNTYMVDIHAQKMIEEALKDNIELKEMQVQLEEKVALLNKSNQQLEQFAYIASHDLQEPLRKIYFYSDYIRKKYNSNLPEEAEILFNKLIGASERMKLLIQDVLAYSTVRKDGFVPVKLNEVFTEVLQDLEIGIEEKNAKLTIADMPVIDGNPTQLKQLFENLISNSLKFARPGITPSITVSAAIQSDSVVISLSDNGIGFEEKYIGKMFDLFQRLHAKDKFSGTGIGLAICKKIVDLHNGTISASGELGSGATFNISLPLQQERAD